MRKKIIFIVGPTAVGKSKLAISVAKKIGGEIVSCDSMQVYKGLDVLSCKPSKSERKQVTHHLIGVVASSQDFDVGKFIKLSRQLIGKIHKRGKIPVFVGGTGLYLDCLLNGIFEGPKGDPKIRNELYGKAKTYGNKYLYTRLKKVDPLAAKRIHINDLRRIVRALEVFRITKKPLSVLQKQRKGILQDERYKIIIFGLSMPREKIYENINRRVDSMFKHGAIREVREILSKRCSKTLKQALGIKEISLYLKGEITIEQARQLLKRNTRRYAKRQVTWFKREPRIVWFEKGSFSKIINEVKKC